MALLKKIGRPPKHGSRAFKDMLLRAGTAALGSETELGKLAVAYKKAWRQELDFPGWSLACDSDLEDACVGNLRRTRALKFALEADLNAPRTLATMEIEAGANQEPNALNRIREARDSHHQDQLQKTLESIREDISTPSGNDGSAVHIPSGDSAFATNAATFALSK
jgi:hypothetical protein